MRKLLPRVYVKVEPIRNSDNSRAGVQVFDLLACQNGSVCKQRLLGLRSLWCGDAQDFMLHLALGLGVEALSQRGDCALKPLHLLSEACQGGCAVTSMPPDRRQNFLRGPALEGFCIRLLGPQSERVEARFVDVHLVRLLVRRGERFVLPLYKLMERLLVLFVNVIPQRFCWVGVLQAGCHILPLEPRNLVRNYRAANVPLTLREQLELHNQGYKTGSGTTHNSEN